MSDDIDQDVDVRAIRLATATALLKKIGILPGTTASFDRDEAHQRLLNVGYRLKGSGRRFANEPTTQEMLALLYGAQKPVALVDAPPATPAVDLPVERTPSATPELDALFSEELPMQEIADRTKIPVAKVWAAHIAFKKRTGDPSVRHVQEKREFLTRSTALLKAKHRELGISPRFLRAYEQFGGEGFESNGGLGDQEKILKDLGFIVNSKKYSKDGDFRVATWRDLLLKTTHYDAIVCDPYTPTHAIDSIDMKPFERLNPVGFFALTFPGPQSLFGNWKSIAKIKERLLCPGQVGSYTRDNVHAYVAHQAKCAQRECYLIAEFQADSIWCMSYMMCFKKIEELYRH